jgi:deoxyguanosine kinase
VFARNAHGNGGDPRYFDGHELPAFRGRVLSLSQNTTKLMIAHPYIGFEGPFGAGKTTLATLMASRTDSDLVLEELDDNEFLSDFYGDRERWSLPMQLSFLALRHRQLATIAQERTRSLIADYTYAKDGAFARQLLRGRELRLYERINGGLSSQLPLPDLVVHLDAPNEVLLGRIRLRGRAYEACIDSAYLDEVRDAYDHHYLRAAGLPIFRYDTAALNLESETQLVGLFEAILAAVPDHGSEKIGALDSDRRRIPHEAR